MGEFMLFWSQLEIGYYVVEEVHYLLTMTGTWN
jgi:hypothetical protein